MIPSCGRYGSLSHARSQSKHLVDSIGLLGVPAQHLAVPAGRAYGVLSKLGIRLTDGRGFSAWGCLPLAKLALLAATRHEQLVMRHCARRNASINASCGGAPQGPLSPYLAEWYDRWYGATYPAA